MNFIQITFENMNHLIKDSYQLGKFGAFLPDSIINRFISDFKDDSSIRLNLDYLLSTRE
jgi:hypothetical protein